MKIKGLRHRLTLIDTVFYQIFKFCLLYSVFCILIAFLLVLVYHFSKGVIHQRTRNFLESPFFVLPHLFSRTSGLPGDIRR